VYLMKNAEGAILYVGKAKRLRTRVLSYFRPGGDGRPRIPFLLSKTSEIEYLVTDTEREALFLENNLIKKHRPPYNIYFRDDKTYYHLRIDFSEEYPRPALVRNPRRDGARYFGPYSSGRSLKATLRYLRKLYPFRTCREGVFRHRSRPCLFHQTGRCPAPCVGLVHPREYRNNLDSLIKVLEGGAPEVEAELKRAIAESADRLDFEKAAEFRDRLAALRELGEKRLVSRAGAPDLDAFAFAEGRGGTAFHVLRTRNGQVEEGISALSRARLPDREEGLESFVLQFYRRREIPGLILLPFPLSGAAALGEVLRERGGGGAPRLLVPRRGENRKLVGLAARNARHALLRDGGRTRLAGTLEGLQNRLRLSNYPARLECFDISSLGGREAVGSMAVFRDGEKSPGDYRRFRIRAEGAADDCAMLAEILRRRLRDRGGEAGIPDLIVLDGGKGQLGAGMKVLEELAVGGPDLIALAKERTRGGLKLRDRVYLPGRKNAAGLLPGTPEFKLLIRARDEAHRFAVSYHRALRRKHALESTLEEIPGVGPVLRKRILEKYGTADAVAGADPEGLDALPGIGPDLARRIVATVRARKERRAGKR